MTISSLLFFSGTFIIRLSNDNQLEWKTATDVPYSAQRDDSPHARGNAIDFDLDLWSRMQHINAR